MPQTLPAPPIAEDCFAIHFERLAPDVPSFEAGAAHAGADPLDNKVALQLGYSADDDQDGPAQRAGCVYLFAERDELDIQVIERVQDLEEMPGGAGDAIAGLHKNDIEAAAAGVPHRFIEPRPACLGAGYPVAVFVHDLEAALDGHLAQAEKLVFWMLIEGRVPEAKSGALHTRRPFGFGEYFAM